MNSSVRFHLINSLMDVRTLCMYWSMRTAAGQTCTWAYDCGQQGQGICMDSNQGSHDLEKSWKMTLVLENSWNSKNVQFVLELPWNFEKISLIITKSHYTPGIYFKGYIVFAFLFVRSYARSFVTFHHVRRIYLKVFGQRFSW